ncbi:MAG: anhydro-N-acetylmuramic acid kinase [Pseudomonadota bacterium]
MPERYVGLMSGTSMDGIDAVLVDFSAARPQVIATHSHDYFSGTRAMLESALQLPDPLTANRRTPRRYPRPAVPQPAFLATMTSPRPAARSAD